MAAGKVWYTAYTIRKEVYMEKNTPKQLAPVNGTPFDYLRWRGDLTFARDGFNEVDNLVLCILSYINFRRIDAVHTKDPAAAPTLAQVAPLLTDKDDQLGLSELSYLPCCVWRHRPNASGTCACSAIPTNTTNRAPSSSTRSPSWCPTAHCLWPSWALTPLWPAGKRTST